MRTSIILAVVLIGLSVGASPTHAQDRVVLSEIVPALRDTEIGALDLGPAPAPGATRTIRRAEILAALREAGRPVDGLVVPRALRIERRAVRLSVEDIVRHAQAAVTEAVSPCELDRLVVTTTATVGEGPVRVAVRASARPSDGAGLVVLELSTPGARTEVPARVELRCPAPVLSAGAEVAVIVRSGRVQISARGVARQAGRRGDEVRVRIEPTGALVTATVVDGHTVEVTP